MHKICKEIFNSEKGVTTYIDTMKEVNDGNRYVPLWNKTLYKLKHYRHIRNNYVHEVGTSQYDICTRDDIEWLNNFYKEIMKTTDPLARYRREKSSYKAVEDVKYIRYTEGGEGEQLQYQNVNSKVAANHNGDENTYFADKIKQNKEKILIGLAYLDRMYNFNIGNTNIKDIILDTPGYFGGTVDLLDWIISIKSLLQ